MMPEIKNKAGFGSLPANDLNLLKQLRNEIGRNVFGQRDQHFSLLIVIKNPPVLIVNHLNLSTVIYIIREHFGHAILANVVEVVFRDVVLAKDAFLLVSKDSTKVGAVFKEFIRCVSEFFLG